MDAFRLDGETAIITGGGSGLGFGIAKSFVQAGAKVVLVGRREAVLREAAAELGEAATTEVFDITHTDKTKAFIQRVAERVGPVTILVNNAGVHFKKTALETTEAEFLQLFNTHITGAIALSQAVAPAMIERKSGTILFIASMNSYIAAPKVMAYSTAKAAMLGLIQSLTADLSPLGLRINGIAPGWIESDILTKALSGDPERKQRILMRTPMNHFGQPEDIGHAAVYLCSPAAKFVSGTVLPVDGGALHGF